MLEQEKNIDQAIEHYRLAVQSKPDHVMGARPGLGLALCTKGSLQEGLKHLARAVELDPGNTALRHNLAITLARLGQHDQAIAQWRQILQREPRNAEALQCLAIEYGQTGQLDKALRTLEEALKIARSAGDEKLAGRIVEQIRRFSRPKPADAGGSR